MCADTLRQVIGVQLIVDNIVPRPYPTELPAKPCCVRPLTLIATLRRRLPVNLPPHRATLSAGTSDGVFACAHPISYFYGAGRICSIRDTHILLHNVLSAPRDAFTGSILFFRTIVSSPPMGSGELPRWFLLHIPTPKCGCQYTAHLDQSPQILDQMSYSTLDRGCGSS
jgi:hypothetical protein